MTNDNGRITQLVYLLPLAFLGLFFVYPLVAIFKLSLTPPLDGLQELWRTPFYGRTFLFTVGQAAVSTLLTLALALPASYVFARYNFWGKRTLRTLSTLPFVLPTVVVANAFTALLGPQGLLNEGLQGAFNLAEPPLNVQYTLTGILLAHVFYNYSIVLRLVSGFWQNLPPDLEQAAQTLGLNEWQAFRRVTWPLLRPAIGAAAVLVFVFCFTSFGVILILGGPRYATIETEIYRQTISAFNLPVAAVLSLGQILFTLGLMSLYTRTQARLALRWRASTAVAKPIRTPTEHLLVGGNVALLLGLLGSPLLALVWRSFSTADGFSVRYYRQLFLNERGSVFFVPPIEAVGNSVSIALAAMLVAVGVGVSLARLVWSAENRPWGGWLDAGLMLPLSASAVTLGFGYIIALNRPPLNLRDSLVLIPIAHALVAMPLVIRVMLPALRRLNPRWREAAASLGATPWQIWWRVERPLTQAAVWVAAVFAFTISMGEFGATVFVARPDTPTMPTAIYRFLGQPGALNYGQALAMSSLLLLVCATCFILIEQFRLGDEGEF